MRQRHPLPPPQVQKAKGGRPREGNRRAILAATMELLENRKFEAVTTDAIAAKAGVSKATIYRWWDSKVSVIIDAFVDYQVINTPLDDSSHPAEALLKHWRMVARQYGSKAGGIASQIIAAGQSDPAIMAEYLGKFYADRYRMARSAVERLLQVCPEFRYRIDADMFMELFYSPIHTRLLLRHLPIDQEFVESFPVKFFRAFGIEFDEQGAVSKLPER